MAETRSRDLQGKTAFDNKAESFGKDVLEVSRLILDVLRQRTAGPKRTFGFEYEFLPHRVLSMEDMENLFVFFRSNGFSDQGGGLVSDLLGVTFEPGGQIEYQSPPMPQSPDDVFEETLSKIVSFNKRIHNDLGIRYIATPYMSGRENSPLLLTSPRYKKMHDRFAKSDKRGLEMMKGTAAIHLHAAIPTLEDLPPLYRLLCELAGSRMSMSAQRRDIWNKTDSSRCGLPMCPEENCNTPLCIISGLVDFSMNAVELDTEKPFRDTPRNKNQKEYFSRFLDHFTTIFTDVRLNLKGGTLELRTLDSMEIPEFRKKWKTFTAMVLDCIPEL